MDMDNAVLQVVMRYLHLVCVALAVGGMAFMSFCLWPVTKKLPEPARADLLKPIQERFLRVVLVAIAGLTISGSYAWMSNAALYRQIGPTAKALIGAKVLLAAVIFAVVIGRSVGLIQPSRFWHRFNLHLAAVVMLLAAVLRYLHIHALAHG